jgi:hypothetical protein
MIDAKEAVRLIDETLDGLTRSRLIPAKLAIAPETVLLGSGSELDSMAFVTFFSDLEDRIQQRTGGEYYLVLNEIAPGESDGPELTVASLARHIERLTASPAQDG